MLMNPNMPLDMQMNPESGNEDIPSEELPPGEEATEEDAITRLQNIQSGNDIETEELPPDNALARLRRFSQGET